MSSLQVADFCNLLVERLQLSGYQDVSIVSDPEGEAVLATSRAGKVFIHVWDRGAMAIVFPRGSDRGFHLNYWSSPLDSPFLEDPVKDMWGQFWEHEKENRELGRVLWMHDSTLKESKIQRQDSEETEDVFSFFS